MHNSTRRLLLLTCAIGGVSCGSDSAVEPTASEPVEARPKRTLTRLTIYPQTLNIVQGFTSNVGVGGRDQHGTYLEVNRSKFRLASSDPAVATVNSEGLVIGIEPGKTSIVVTALADTSMRAQMDVVVADSIAVKSREVWRDHNGWYPSPAYVLAGGEVVWNLPSFETSALHLWKGEEDAQRHSIDRTATTFKLTFLEPGTFEFCTGGCWDPPDFGTIHVR